MTTLATPSVNQVRSTLASSYTRGTDTTIILADGTLFPSPTPLGHVIYLHNGDETKFCLVIYTSKAANTLTMGGGATDYALAKNVSVGDEAYEFPVGTIVDLVCAADEIAHLFTDAAAAIHDDVAGEIVAVTEKTVPIGADEILAEDSADSNNKKSVKLSNLGSAGVPMKTPSAVTIYVDTGGNDSTGDGSSGSPYLTVGKAIAHYVEKYAWISEACVIAIGAGTFQITTTLSLAGLVIPRLLTIKGMDASDNDLFTEGTAGAGAAQTITLAGGASWATNFWAGATVWIHYGTGLGQHRTVISSTNADPCVLTISSGATDWSVNPDNTSVYVLAGLAIIEDNNALNNAFVAAGINNVKLQGLRLKDFESYGISIRNCLNWVIHACYIDTATGRGLYLNSTTGDVRHCYFNVEDLGLVYEDSFIIVYFNVFERNGAAGSNTGVKADFGSIMNMHTGSYANLLIDWAVGIKAQNGSVVDAGNSQTFVNCTTDTDPAAASDPAYIS